VRKTNSQALEAFAALHLGEKKIRVCKTPIASIILACLLSVKEDSDEKKCEAKVPKSLKKNESGNERYDDDDDAGLSW
jgi:hypothetical protein